MAAPSIPPSKNSPMDNFVQPVVASGPQPPPPTASPLDNSIQHHVPSGQPPSMSLADTRLKTLRLLLQGYSSLSVPTLLQPLSPHFTHEVLPQSLGMPVRGKEDFSHHAAMVFSAFKSFEMKPTDLWEDPDRGEVILRCAMEGVLKTKEKPEGEKEESKAEEDGTVEGEAPKEEVTPHVDMEDEEYCPDEDPDLEPVDLSNILGDLPELPDNKPGTVLSTITEVTEPPSEFDSPPCSSSFNLSNNPSSQEEKPTSSSSPSSLEDAHRPSPPPAPEESSQQEDPNKSTTPPNTEMIHWNNECLLIISFTPCGSQISKIQEFVDSAKAVEMKKKHAPKGFDEASAPPPSTYKPATYLNLDTLKLKDAHSSVTVTELPPSPVESPVSSVGSPGSMTGISPTTTPHVALNRDTLHRLDKGVQCAMDRDSDSLVDTQQLDIDTFSTTTEYPSSSACGRGNSLLCCLDKMAWQWHSTEGADADEAETEGEVFQGRGVGQKNASAFPPSSSSSSTSTSASAALLLSRLAAKKSEQKRKSKSKSKSKSKRPPVRFAKNVDVGKEEDIGGLFSSSSSSGSGSSSSYSSSSAEGSGAGSESGHFPSSGFWSSGDDRVDNFNGGGGDGQGKGWSSSTIADTIEVINQFVPSQLLPVDVDSRTKEMVVKKEWVSGAATFVAGFALGKLWFGGGRGGGSR